MNTLPTIAVLPRAPRNGSPVPELTSLFHKSWRGNYGDPRYPGNCSGELIKDLLRYFRSNNVLDPMTGSGTCGDVCRELGIACRSADLCATRFDRADACDPKNYADIGMFDFIWLHPPYWRQKKYSDDPRDLSTCPTLPAFLNRLHFLLLNCHSVLAPGGIMAILMGNYCDREAGYVNLVFETQHLCRTMGLRQPCTEIIRFSHGASSSRKSYKSSFIPGLHDVCSIFTKPEKASGVVALAA